jgi:hypothetical protein
MILNEVSQAHLSSKHPTQNYEGLDVYQSSRCCLSSVAARSISEGSAPRALNVASTEPSGRYRTITSASASVQ